jgi:hypothetical protein
MDKSKVAILVTTHCDNDARKFMTQKICEKFSKSGYFLCLTGHTTVDTETMNSCNLFLYDSNNEMLLDGREQQTRNGPPEVRSVQDALTLLASKGFTHVFKTTYDVNPTIDVDKIVETHSQNGKKLTTMTDDKHCSTLAYFGEIDFILKTYNFDMLRNYGFDMIVEHAWRQQIIRMGLIDEVCQDYNTDSKMLLIDDTRAHFYHLSNLMYINEYKGLLNV